MKKGILLYLLVSITTFVFCKPIEIATAKLVGQNFLSTRTSNVFSKTGAELELVLTANSAGNIVTPGTTATSYFYIFNVANGDGFIIVSADDKTIPILGYSTQADFNPNNIAPQTAKWLEGYKAEVRYILENNITQTQEIATEWSDLKAAKPVNTISASVSPLIQTRWDQSPYYNALCPYDNSAGQRTVSGCVATAMAQVMKFWQFPTKGTGNHSYNHSSYGTLSANFGSTTYNWSSMPNRVTSSNTAVATLMYHCGVSVDMNYDVASNGGSGAYVISAQSPVTHCTEYALKTYFGYKNTLKGEQRSNYSQTQWLTLIKGELNGGRPVIYAGFGSGGGHAFVCDGYDNNDFLHFNWGWDGQYDGYFSVNALNPTGTGTGGGTGGFNSGHQAVIGIEPPTGGGTTTLDMRLYSSMVVSPDPIKYNQAFSVTVNVANYGTTSAQNFNGDFRMSVFNSNNEFVADIGTKTAQTLEFNKYYTNPLVFSTASISALTPGTYKIGLYYKASSASTWTAFADGNYQNFVSVDVEGNNTNTLKLYAPVTTTPTIIVRNQTFTVDFDIANFGSSTFNGEVSVDIHKSDGTWIRELSLKSGLSLPSNTHFTNGLSYTITGGISDEAGTYQLFIWDKPSNGSWEFLGNGNYANPITIQVVDPEPVADIYEINNTVGQAFNLPVTFSGNTAKTTTPGSTCHKGTDYDYYKVVLPAGYNYTINARIHDTYNSGNGQTYTFDGLASYSTDGTTWSDAFDDVISTPITVNGGGTVYFFVSPYFTGETGTYLFDASITRTQALSSAKEITGFTVPGIIGNADIYTSNATIELDVTASTDITALVPTITISPSATINPASGAVRNFTNPVNYTVTAQDGSTKVWTVTVTKKSGIGIEDIALTNNVNVYPNPADKELVVNLEGFVGTVSNISLVSIEGKIVINQAPIANAQAVLNVSSLEAGVYMLKINSDKGDITKKIIVQ